MEGTFFLKWKPSLPWLGVISFHTAPMIAFATDFFGCTLWAGNIFSKLFSEERRLQIWSRALIESVYVATRERCQSPLGSQRVSSLQWGPIVGLGRVM